MNLRWMLAVMGATVAFGAFFAMLDEDDESEARRRDPMDDRRHAADAARAGSTVGPGAGAYATSERIAPGEDERPSLSVDGRASVAPSIRPSEMAPVPELANPFAPRPRPAQVHPESFESSDAEVVYWRGQRTLARDVVQTSEAHVVALQINLDKAERRDDPAAVAKAREMIEAVEDRIEVERAAVEEFDERLEAAKAAL